MGLKKSDYLNPQLNITAANNSKLKIEGAAFMTLTGPEGHRTHKLVYLADKIDTFYLSKTACGELKIINNQFPKPMTA